MELTTEQQEAFMYMMSGKSVFITGKAGTGKTALLKHFIQEYIAEHGIISLGITSTTGISAILLKGTTLHSYLGIGLGTASEGVLIETVKRFPYLDRWRGLRTLIIDEVSMLSYTLFVKLEKMAQVLRFSREPFGGIQLVLCGDFLQLPCINDRFCFEAEDIWKACITKTFYFKNIMRQSDIEFQTCLSEIRLGILSEKSMALLQTREKKCRDKKFKPTKFYATNREVNSVNTKELEKIAQESGEIFEYNMTITAMDPKRKEALTKFIKTNVIVPDLVELAVGCQVMLLSNIDIENGLVNGSRGVITQFINGYPEVEFINGKTLIIKYHSFDVEEYGKKVACYTQIPLKLAYAISIHKSQGCTIDYAEINMGKIFEYGQAYVALSRVKTLDGLFILNLDPKKIKAHPKALEYYNSLEQ